MRRANRRPAAGAGLRRPAARLAIRRPAAALGGADLTPRERWEAGEEISAEEFAPGVVGSGDWLKSVKASYFEKECTFAGKINRVVLEGTDTELEITLTGTSTEELLKFGSGVHPPVIRAHLCPRDCDQKRSNQDLVHLKKFRKITPEGERTWEENLLATDENAPLRGAQQAWEREEEKKQKRDRETSSDSRGGGGKKKEKKKEKKRSKSKKEKKEKRARVGGRSVAKKDLKDLYGGTGLDPEPKMRRKLRKKLKRKLKKAKSTSSASSGTSTSSSTEEVGEEILEDRSKVQRIAELAPGVLTATSVQNMKNYVLQASGSTWGADVDSIPPIMSQYVRCFLAPKSSGGLLREATMLAFAADLMVQGRPAEALDALSQRLKSLELVVNGEAWGTAQKIEIVPPHDASMASRAEVQIAHREALLDSRAKGNQAPWEKGKSKGKGKDKDKGKERSKGGTKGKEENKKSS